MKRRGRSVVKLTTVLSMGISLLVSAKSYAEDPAHWVGGKSDEEYENDWFDGVGICDNLVGGFVNRMDDYSNAERTIWSSLHSAEVRFRENSGYETTTGWGVDGNDIFAVCTHGGAWTDRFTQVMWNEGVRAFSDEMRMGDDGRQLGVFISWSCLIMQVDGFVSRWDSVFAGGLKAAMGYYDSLTFYDPSMNNFGKNLANKMQSSSGDYTLRYAWLDTMDDYVNQYLSFAVTGTDSTDCSSRRSSMTLNNYQSKTRLQDGNVGYYCWTRRAS